VLGQLERADMLDRGGDFREIIKKRKRRIIRISNTTHTI
jgi:hypothetical protein